MAHDPTNPAPDIDYPCSWEYTVIGPSARSIREAVGRIVAERDHTLVPSNTSRTGKYSSMKLQLTVASSEDRDAIFRALADHPHVTIVL